MWRLQSHGFWSFEANWLMDQLTMNKFCVQIFWRDTALMAVCLNDVKVENGCTGCLRMKSWQKSQRMSHLIVSDELAYFSSRFFSTTVKLRGIFETWIFRMDRKKIQYFKSQVIKILRKNAKPHILSFDNNYISTIKLRKQRLRSENSCIIMSILPTEFHPIVHRSEDPAQDWGIFPCKQELVGRVFIQYRTKRWRCHAI